MPYTINKTNGIKLVTLSDGTLDITSTDVALFGKGYAGFGEKLNENFVKVLENFANTTSPAKKITGQLWYDTINNQLNVYTGKKFKPVGSSSNAKTQPTQAVIGDTWFDTNNNQLYVYNGTAWTLIGPTSVAGSGVTQVISDTVTDSVGVNRSVLRLVTNDISVAIVSPVQFTPSPAIAGFSTIFVGITMNSTTLSGAKFVGTSTDSDALDGNPASSFLPTSGGTITGNLAVNNTINLGATSEISHSITLGDYTVQNDTSNGDILFNVNKNGSIGYNVLKIDGQLGSVTVNGNLTVNGTKTVINTTNLTIEDNLIELNRNISTAAGMPNYSGLKVNRGESSSETEQDLYWVWDETFADDGTTVYGNAGGAWTAYRSQDDDLSAPTLVDIRANIVHATSTSAQYADLAERYESDMLLEAGDVVIMGGTKEITASTSSYDDAVFGVVSESPAFLMNKDAGNNESHPMIALKGRVHVKVKGTGKKGDRIVSSDEKGIAQVAQIDECTLFNVLGRLIKDKYVQDTQLTECTVGK
jgi:hypothetical protein